MDVVVAKARQTSSSPTSNYLDNLLLRNQGASSLAKDRNSLLDLLLQLGFLVNGGKSNRFVHLGIEFLTGLNLARLPEKCTLKVTELARQVYLSEAECSGRPLTPRQALLTPATTASFCLLAPVLG